MIDRRDSPRIPLDAPCLLTMVVNYSGSVHAMALDVSQGGMQLALAPGTDEKSLTPGTPVTLRDISPPFDRLLDDAHGKIAWVGVRCCGVRFNRKLPLAADDVVDFARL